MNKLNIKYFINIFNQSLVSGSNFISVIIILRLSNLEILGIFNFIYIISLFFISLQNSLTILPLNSLYPKITYTDKNNFFASANLLQLFFLTILIFVILIFFMFEYQNFWLIYLKDHKIILITFFLSTIIYNYFRRINLIKNKFLEIFIFDLLIHFCLFFLFFYFNQINELNLKLILYSYIISFGFIPLMLIVLQNKTFKLKFSTKYLTKILNFGRWMLLTAIYDFFSFNIWFFVSTILLGPTIGGILRSTQTLGNAANIIFMSFENIVPKMSAKIYLNSGLKSLNKYLINFTIIGLLFGFIILLIVFFFSDLLFNFFYQNKLNQYENYTFFFIATSLSQFLTFPFIYKLRALELPKLIQLSSLYTAIFSILFSYLLIKKLNIEGFFIGYAISIFINIASLYYYNYKIKNYGKFR